MNTRHDLNETFSRCAIPADARNTMIFGQKFFLVILVCIYISRVVQHWRACRGRIRARQTMQIREALMRRYGL